MADPTLQQQITALIMREASSIATDIIEAVRQDGEARSAQKAWARVDIYRKAFDAITGSITHVHRIVQNAQADLNKLLMVAVANPPGSMLPGKHDDDHCKHDDDHCNDADCPDHGFIQKIDHHTRAPNRPTEATIVEGDDRAGAFAELNDNTWIATLERRGPGEVFFLLKINDKIRAQVPFDNLVKAAVRIDPDYATGPERQIQDLREKLAKAEAKRYDEQARADQLEARLAAVSETSKA